MSEVLDLRRLVLLLGAEAYEYHRTVAVVSATFAGIILLSAVYLKNDAASDAFYFGWFAVMLFAWGFALASRAFRSLHDKTHNTAFLLLPASSLEKVVAPLLLVTPVFVAYLVLFTTLVSWLSEAANALLTRSRDPVFQPFDPRVWALAAHYVVLQSVFFLGGAWFRKNHFFKTVLSLIVLALGLGVVSFVVNRIALAPYFDPGSLEWLSDGLPYDFYVEHRRLLDAAATVALVLYFVVLPLYCWTVAWLRVRETQVSDGI